MVIDRRKFITKWSVYDMFSLSIYRWNKFKVIPLASRLRTRRVTAVFYDVHRTPLTKLDGFSGRGLMLVTSSANCIAFLSSSSSRFRGGMLCCLCLLASLTFSHHEQLMKKMKNGLLDIASQCWTDWWSVSQSAPGYVRQFTKLVFHLCAIQM